MNLRAMVGRELNLRAMRRHRSRIGWRVAPIYSHYLVRCQREAPASEVLEEPLGTCIDEFRRNAVTSFQTSATGEVARTMSRRIAEREAAGETIWKPLDQYGGRNYAGNVWLDFPEIEKLFRGDLGRFLRAYFRSQFKILHGILYRSVALDDGRMGSQKWHSDGGPGICINVMFYLHDMGSEDGALEVLPWERSLRVFQSEPLPSSSQDKRDTLTAHYERMISQQHLAAVVRPTGAAGLVVPFLNNTLHRGGYPKPGRTRTAMVFHCYPSHKPTDFERYRGAGIDKTIPYPKDPAVEF